ncbi:MAG: creatininase family protein [Fuerstiella sp.]|nr:creatininase family protein [Fuerstiella sp.]
MLDQYLPSEINSGPWITGWSLFELRKLPVAAEFVLPICSIGTPYEQLLELGPRLLPPLFHEAMSGDLRERIVARILKCFPKYGDDVGNPARVRIVDVPAERLEPVSAPRVLAFSVDTAVEEHGPHLPLGTDTIQSYSVLRELAHTVEGFEVGRPLEYGQLTWALPFGFSIDLTTELLTEYVTGYVNAVTAWQKPEAVYAVDVHGSITHRQAIVDGLSQSDFSNWAFRWLHEPLAEFASERGDQHAGGVETILVERVATELIDKHWWPGREQEIAAGCMTLEKAIELTPDLAAFETYAVDHGCNGIVGDIGNYHALNADLMFGRMLAMAADDVDGLLNGANAGGQQAGQKLW